MCPVGKIARKKITEVKYSWVAREKGILRDLVLYNLVGNSPPFSFVRAGDAELRILEGRRYINPATKKKNLSKDFVYSLARSLEVASIVGLPRNYIDKNHPQGWDTKIKEACLKLGTTVSQNVISASIFNIAPEFLGEIVSNRNILIINFEAHRFIRLFKDENFCNYYGFKNVNCECLDIPDGRGGYLYDGSSMDSIVNQVYDQLDKFDNYDIALIGAGAMANVIATYIQTVCSKTALDVGSLLSAMRGQRNRGHLRKNGKKSFLVFEK